MKRILVAFALVPALAHADTQEPVPDVHVAPEAPRARRIAIEVLPLPIITDLGKWSADLVIVPIDHHALVVSPFYTTTSTAPIVIQDATGAPMTQLPEQEFRGVGIEVGYRYYTGFAGPRGWFIGLSLIAVSMNERQGQFGDGSQTHYADLGLAVDAGYQVVIGDSVSLGLGAGVQGLITTKTIPDQQYPAKVYGNAGIWPRLLLSIGWAL